MTPDPLSQPVTLSLRSTETLNPEDSLERAGTLLRNTAYPFIPIVEGGKLVGVVSEASLAFALSESRELSEPCTVASVNVPQLGPQATGAEALRLLTNGGLSALLIVDEAGHVAGVVGPSDLIPQPRRTPTPPLIGGMATPFGVYLTTGSVQGGAGAYALMASGALLSCLFLGADQAVTFAIEAWPKLSPYTGLLFAALFLLSIRVIPLSGTHAAEHMVVHAIERGEQLIPSVVRRMPRVHPRCGTNLAVAGSLFMGLVSLPWSDDFELRMIAAFVATYLLYRPLGSMVQLFITTKPPTEKQLSNGIQAGTQLLERYALRRGPVASPWQRILNSGMLHVMAGSASALLAIEGLARLFKLPITVL